MTRSPLELLAGPIPALVGIIDQHWEWAGQLEMSSDCQVSQLGSSCVCIWPRLWARGLALEAGNQIYQIIYISIPKQIFISANWADKVSGSGFPWDVGHSSSLPWGPHSSGGWWWTTKIMTLSLRIWRWIFSWYPLFICRPVSFSLCVAALPACWSPQLAFRNQNSLLKPTAPWPEDNLAFEIYFYKRDLVF